MGQSELSHYRPDEGTRVRPNAQARRHRNRHAAGTRTDIKRVIGLPGDTLRMVDGQLTINDQAVKRQVLPPDMVPIDVDSPCGSDHDPALYDFRVKGSGGKPYCRVPVVRETLPDGHSYETVELGRSAKTILGRSRSPKAMSG